MANLKKEYTDIKEIRHNVEHLTVSNIEDDNREWMVGELFRILSKPAKLL